MATTTAAASRLFLSSCRGSRVRPRPWPGCAATPSVSLSPPQSPTSTRSSSTRAFSSAGGGASHHHQDDGVDDDDDDDDDVRMVVAAAERGLVIGRGGQLPWDLPEDRRHFFHLTRGHVLVLGRRSYEESGHALPGRTTIVVSRTLGSLPDAHVAPCLPQALALARRLKRQQQQQQASSSNDSRVITWIGGGHDLYAEAMAMPPGEPSRCRLLYLTRIHLQDVEGDAFFPAAWRSHFPRPVWACPSTRHPCMYEIHARGGVSLKDGER